MSFLRSSAASLSAPCSTANMSIAPRDASSRTPNNHKMLPQTIAGFFYDSENINRRFIGVPGVRPPSLEFLPFNNDNVAISDCCNGLILCWCLGANGYRYVVCNPIT
jgi:hypothetical protein